MADQADVETALVQLVSGAIYPAGTAMPSVVGVDCRVYRGWPSSAALDADLAAGKVNITVFPLPGQQRNTTRFPDTWHAMRTVPSLQAVVVGDEVAFSGTADAGQVVGLLVDGAAYRYVTVGGDTPRSVALAMIGQLPAGSLALLLNETLRFPDAFRLKARVVCPAMSSREVRRQTQAFRISFWCPSPTLRDQVVALADLSLAGQTFIDLADASAGRVQYVRTETVDRTSDAALYRRDLIYAVEFGTRLSELQPAMLFGDLNLNDGLDVLA